jgi:crotonobetainyl-CoA:carnitine CoA-transferase CaiB-like acyl-CoA transferase
MRHQNEIDEAIKAWTRNLSNDEVQTRLTAVGVPAERARHADGVVDSEDTGRVFRPVLMPGASKPELAATLPFTLSVSETLTPQTPGPIGFYTRTALSEWIGMTDAEIDELESAGALK